MAVRVPLVVRSSAGRVARSPAILNGGFEASRPQLLLPARFIDTLVKDYRRKARRRRYQAAGGTPLLLYELPGSWEAWVETRDREGVHARVRVLVSDTESELLVSDSGIDALRIRIEAFSPGRWRFSNESKTRPSARPRRW